jgi:hypothetical protein
MSSIRGAVKYTASFQAETYSLPALDMSQAHTHESLILLR